MEGRFLSHALTTTTLFTLLFFTVYYIDSCSATKPNTTYIRNSCNATLYPQLCYKSLSSYANDIQTSPKLLATTALSVTLSATKSTCATMKNLSKIHGMKPRESAAMVDCVQMLGDSVYELQRSIEEMGSVGGPYSHFEFQMSNIETWASAALTDDDTCTEGFAGKAMNGVVKTKVQRYIVEVAHLTSNALAFVNHYAAQHKPFATSP